MNSIDDGPYLIGEQLVEKLRGIQPGFGQRLKQERTRLQKSQDDFGTICGVQRLTQFQYEHENTSPDVNYLGKAASAGVDLIYVLFGISTSKLFPTDKQQDEADLRSFELIDAWCAKHPTGNVAAETRWMLFKIFRTHSVLSNDASSILASSLTADPKTLAVEAKTGS